MPQLQGFVAQIPVRLVGHTPKPHYPKQFKHLGDELRARRIDLGLRQRDLAERFGVCEESVSSWELGHSGPALRFYPAIIDWLGYNPTPEAVSPGEGIRRARIARGLSIRALSKLVGVDEATVSKLEQGKFNVRMSVVHQALKALGI